MHMTFDNNDNIISKLRRKQINGNNTKAVSINK